MAGGASTAGFLTVDGVRLEYRRVAAPADAGAAVPTLVLLHEGLGCVALWKDFPDRLAAATGLGVFLWSRAGFGRSDPVPLPRPLDYLEREVPMAGRVMEAAGVERPVLVGHSDGGTIALLYAAREDAGHVEGVVTMAAHVFVEDVTIEGILQAKRAWETGDLRARLSRWHGDNVGCAFHGWCDTWLDPAFRAWNIEAQIAPVRAPVLAMQGCDDQYGTRAQVDAIVAAVAGPSEAMMLPGCGHSPHTDQRDVVIRAIGQFVAGLPGR